MAQINAKIDEQLLKEFRGVIYIRKGLRKGDFQQSLEEAMGEYILKHSKSESAKHFVKHYKELKGT